MAQDRLHVGRPERPAAATRTRSPARTTAPSRRRRAAATSDASSIHSTPASPSTFATSCGSVTTRGRPVRHDRARELGGRELGGLDVHVRVDEPRAPATGRGRRPARRRRTGRARRSRPPDTATSSSSHSRVNTDSTRAPSITRSGGSSPRATAIRAGRSPRLRRRFEPHVDPVRARVERRRHDVAERGQHRGATPASSVSPGPPSCAIPDGSATARGRLERLVRPGDREVRRQLGGRDGHRQIPTMSSGRTGTRVSAAPVAARSAATIAGRRGDRRRLADAAQPVRRARVGQLEHVELAPAACRARSGSGSR